MMLEQCLVKELKTRPGLKVRLPALVSCVVITVPNWCMDNM